VLHREVEVVGREVVVVVGREEKTLDHDDEREVEAVAVATGRPVATGRAWATGVPLAPGVLTGRPTAVGTWPARAAGVGLWTTRPLVTVGDP